MKTGRIYNAHVVTPECLQPGAAVDCQDGRVTQILPAAHSGDIDIEGCYLLPGLIDIHTHPTPEDGADPAQLAALCDDLRAHGTAAFLFATGNMAIQQQLHALRRLRTCIEAVGPNRGCLGIHLEGPYVAAEARGGFLPQALANPRDFPLPPLLEACGPWARYINISPELPGAIDAIRTCRRSGLAVSIGHSDASRESLVAAVDAGAGAACHTFNTGRIMRFKEPGVLDVTLDLFALATNRLVCELIGDGIHVDPLLVRLMYRAKGPDGMALITDSLLGGRPACEGQEVAAPLTRYRVVQGAARDPEGGLCGSTLTMARAVANFTRFTGCSLVEAARAAALTPARLLGIETDYGALQPGRRALFCVLDANLEPRVDLCRRLNEVS